jgi:hypothetical protein
MGSVGLTNFLNKLKLFWYKYLSVVDSELVVIYS